MGPSAVCRVALLNSARPWIGEAAHTFALAQGLRERGIDVTLVVRRGHELERRAAETELRVESLTFHSRFSWVSDRADVLRLRAILARDRPQIVHCHRGKDHWIAALALRRVRPRPALLRTRHVVTPMRGHLFNRWLLTRATDCTLAVSHAARVSLQHVLSPHQFAAVPVIYAGVDLQAFHPRRRSEIWRREVLGLGENELAVGLVGRIQNVKGQSVFLRAAAMLAERGAAAKFLIAGIERSPGRIDALREEADQMRLAERVVFLPEIPEIETAIGSLDVGVIASLGSEGSSRIAYETLASGVPLVATRVGVLPEIIRHGENGLLCPPGEPESLAFQIGLLLEDADLRRRLGEAGRRHVEEHHSLDLWLDSLCTLYDQVAARGLVAAPAGV
jgi:glycosyltransferase involved in cell wall biosynthesis